MGLGRIPNTSVLFRHVVYPAGFQGKAKMFVPDKFIRLEEKDGKLVTSLAWRRFLPTSAFVNAYGCRMAQERNVRAAAKATSRQSTRHTYAGAFALNAGFVRRLGKNKGLDEIGKTDVVHLVEFGEIAHVELSVSVSPEMVDDQGLRTLVVDRIWHSCSGPLRHVCSCDADLSDHPNAQLELAPKGDYFDGRGPVRLRCAELLCSFLTISWRKWTAFQSLFHRHTLG